MPASRKARDAQMLLPLWASPFVIAQRPLGRWTAAAMIVSFVVAANYFQFTNHFAGTWLNPLQSYLLGAAVIVWVLIYRAAHASRPASRLAGALGQA